MQQPEPDQRGAEPDAPGDDSPAAGSAAANSAAASTSSAGAAAGDAPGIDPGPGPILFYDGVCGLCDGFVQWFLAHDRRGIVRLTPLQGETSRQLLGERSKDPRGWSVVLRVEGMTFRRSDAVLELTRLMGRPWSLLVLLRFIPRFLRDPLYRLVARIRYLVFGKRESCRVPSPEVAARFLP